MDYLSVGGVVFFGLKVLIVKCYGLSDFKVVYFILK